MIRTSKQLKDKVRNMSKGDSAKAQMLIRNYMMERFLERISISKYRDNFVLKGGMLVASVIGVSVADEVSLRVTKCEISMTYICS